MLLSAPCVSILILRAKKEQTKDKTILSLHPTPPKSHCGTLCLFVAGTKIITFVLFVCFKMTKKLAYFQKFDKNLAHSNFVWLMPEHEQGAPVHIPASDLMWDVVR